MSSADLSDAEFYKREWESACERYDYAIEERDFYLSELNKYKRAMAVAKERIERHWSGNSEDTCLEIARILEEE